MTKENKQPPRVLVLDNGTVLIVRCEEVDTPCMGNFLECTEVRYNCLRDASLGLAHLLKTGPNDAIDDVFIQREIIKKKSIVRAIDLDVNVWKSLYPTN